LGGLLAIVAGLCPLLAVAQDDPHMEGVVHEHEGDAPTPTEAATTQPSQPVTGETVTYGSSAPDAGDATPLTGYLARPTDHEGPLPALIVVHEWWGLNDNVRAMTDRLAGEGYLALAVDLYGGAVAEDPETARTLVTEALDHLDRIGANVAQGLDYLAAHNDGGELGVIGWCFGGAVSLQTAIRAGDRLDAAVIYYGRLVTEPEELSAIQAPILAFFGTEDESIPVETVRAFEAAAQGVGKSVEVHVYEGANHAFANPSGHNYDAEAATDAWTRTVAFLARELGPR
jgi:carboxymethylenebutenolidase